MLFWRGALHASRRTCVSLRSALRSLNTGSGAASGAAPVSSARAELGPWNEWNTECGLTFDAGNGMSAIGANWIGQGSRKWAPKLRPLRNSRAFSTGKDGGTVEGHCFRCGSPLVYLSDGDRDRLTCTSCSYIHYQNPKMVVGAIVEHEGKVMLCRRGIEPQAGLWTVPAGYLEMGESTADGARRETFEEAAATVDIIAPYCHYDIVTINQTYLLFRARLAHPFTWSAQLPESTEVAFFDLDSIPFKELAFSSVALALSRYIEEHKRGGGFSFQYGTIKKQPGSGPHEPGTFNLVEQWQIPS